MYLESIGISVQQHNHQMQLVLVADPFTPAYKAGADFMQQLAKMLSQKCVGGGKGEGSRFEHTLLIFPPETRCRSGLPLM